jgi:hypothetical protein
MVKTSADEGRGPNQGNTKQQVVLIAGCNSSECLDADRNPIRPCAVIGLAQITFGYWPYQTQPIKEGVFRQTAG